MSVYDHEALRTRIATSAASVSVNDIAPALVAEALARREAELTVDGAVSVSTGAFTGRSPKDKFIVRDGLTEDKVWWDNSGAMSPAHFDVLLDDAIASLGGKALAAPGPAGRRRPEISICRDGADPQRLACPVHPQSADPPGRSGSRRERRPTSPSCTCPISRPTRPAMAAAPIR